MKVTRQTGKELVVVDSTLWVAAIAGLAGLVLLAVAIAGRKIKGAAGACLFLLFAFIALQKSTFVFNAEERMVHWRLLRYFNTLTGSTAFEAINDIGIQSTSSVSGGTSYRLTLVTAKGAMPMSAAYSGGSKHHEALREQILLFIMGDQAQAKAAIGGGAAAIESSAVSLLKQGRKIDAIRLLTSSGEMNLTEATQRVTEIEQAMRATK